MARLINQVKENKIPAVFCESTVSNESQLVVADETGAKFGGNLYVDSLSQEDGPASTYLNMLNHNLNLIKDGLNDNSQRLISNLLFNNKSYRPQIQILDDLMLVHLRHLSTCQQHIQEDTQTY